MSTSWNSSLYLPLYKNNMKPLSKIQNLIYCIGGILLLVGAVMPLFLVHVSVAPYVFCAGTLMFSSMQLLAAYEGDDFVVRRLRRQQILGALLLVASGVLFPLGHLQPAWLQGDEWLLLLTIAAVLEVYTAFRLPAALAKAEQKNK